MLDKTVKMSLRSDRRKNPNFYEFKQLEYADLRALSSGSHSVSIKVIGDGRGVVRLSQSFGFDI